MSATVDSLSIKVDASARGANQQLDKLVQKMIQLRSTVNGINVGNLNTMAASIQNFSKAAAGLNQVKTSDFTRMAKSIEKLSNIRNGELNRAATAITNISKAFSGIGNVSDGANKIAQLAQGISKLGYKSTTQAIQNIPLLTKELKNMMSELSKAPTVSSNIIAMTNAMANLGAQASGIRSLGSAMNSAGTRGNGFFGTMKKGISNIKSFVSNIRSATTHNRSFASTLGLLYAKFWTLQRGIGALGNAVKSSMDYIEEYNYFNVTMEKIASEWSDDFKKYGYENGDAYGKSFQNRVTEIMNKMTGFKMNDDGTLTDSGIKNLGLDVTQMTNYAAGVAQVTNSVGLTGEASVVTSKALSMLAGDMSSFRNLDMSTVMTNFSSGLIGQSRALYKYGIDITNATLATYAHEMGIKKDITAMTQGEKMQLRMIAILDQSKVAWGDLAKTINSPSNQLRLLQNNFKALARTIGNMFLPVVAKVLPYVNGLVIAIRRLFEWTASMLGIDLKDVIGNSGGGYSDMFDGLEEDADNADSSISNIGDSADKSTESVKKLAKQLMGFDELNVITTNDNGSSDNKNNNNGDSAPIDLTDKLSAALADYEKVWNEAYKDMTNDAEKFADKLTKLFKDAWTSGDGTDIGTAIAKWINKGITWVNKNVDSFAANLEKMAGILATAFNGFVEELDWEGLGTAIGKSLKAYFDAETHFFDKVNWVNFGKSLSTSLNAAVDSGVIQSSFTAIAAKLKAAIETAFGAVTTFKFDNLGKAIGQGINDFFDKMGKVNKETGLNGWQELGKTISDGIKGIATTITTAVSEVDWEDTGKAIMDSILSIDFVGIVKNVRDASASIANALGKVIDGIDWEDLGKSLADTIGELITGIEWEHIFSAVKLIGKLANAIFNFIKGALVGSVEGLKKYIPEWIESIGNFAIKIGVALGEKASTFGNKVKTFISELPKNVIIFVLQIGSKLKDLSDDISEFLKKLPEKAFRFAMQIANKANDISTKISDFIERLPQKAYGFAMKVASTAGTVCGKIVRFIRKLPQKTYGFAMKIGSKKNDIAKKIENFIKSIPTKAYGVAMKIGDTAKAFKEKVMNFIKGVVKLGGMAVAITATFNDAFTKPLKAAWNVLAKAINGALKTINKIPGVNIKMKLPILEKGGIYSGGTWHNIEKYAGGGLPGMGQMFVAREAGPELVGTIGGHTAVMNNNQIVASVSDGVFNALAPVLTQVCNAVNNLQANASGGQPLYVEGVSDGDIVRITTKANSDYRKRYGKPLYS